MYVPQRPSMFPIAPMRNLLTCLPRLTLAQLRTIRSTTVCTCRRELENFPSPRDSTFCSLFAGRWCRCLGRHSDHLIVHHQREHSFTCVCSCSKVPIAPMGKCLVDMSISILIFYDGCCLELPVWSTCCLRLKLQKFPSPRWETHVLLVVCRAAVFVSMEAQCQS
jgi:hypothetical protein